MKTVGYTLERVSPKLQEIEVNGGLQEAGKIERG